MNVTRESAPEKVARLRGCLNDLVAIMALPALWTGGEPAQIVSTVLDALLESLQLAFVHVRLNDPQGGAPIEMIRVAESLAGTARLPEFSAALDSLLGGTPLNWSPHAHISVGDVDFSIAGVPLGLRSEIGIIAAGSPRSDFPTQTEKLVLDVAANQAAIGLQEARLLSESERNSRLLVDSIPGLVALLATDGKVQFANHQILEYTGRSLEELKQWGTNDIVHPEDLPRVGPKFAHEIASRAPFGFEVRIQRFDGVYRWFQLCAHPLRDSTGRVVRWYVLLTDIDDRKRAEDVIRASEFNLQLIIDTIPALAWSARTDGSADYFNQHYLDFIGFSAEQASGWGWTAAVHPEDLNGLAVTWQQIMASEAPGEAEARLRRYDGNYRWFLFRANPLRDETGAIVKWYGVNTDIEDRKLAEAELKRAYDSFAEAQRLSKTGSYVTDIVGGDRTWSEETYRIFGFDPATKVTEQRVRDVVHPDDLPSYDAGVARALDGADFDLVFRISTPSGKVKHVRSLARLVERISGRPLFIGAIQDVTENTVAEEALNRARSELAHVARVTAMSALTASIAHEVNQPLSGIITNASTGLRMLDADPPDVAGARETVRRTLRDGNRASDVIARLRALFSRKEFTLELLDLNEATREAIALSLSELQQNRVVLHLEFADDLPTVTGDRIQLQQVILNLLRNASDAMVDVHNRPRQLLIKTEREDGDRVRVSVRDAGVGVDPQTMNKLFGAFHTTKRGGMGIGLFVSRSIIEAHQGRLWAEPNDGGPGTTFSFSIPRTAEDILDAVPVLRTS